jgi:hypothetical protein
MRMFAPVVHSTAQTYTLLQPERALDVREEPLRKECKGPATETFQ